MEMFRRWLDFVCVDTDGHETRSMSYDLEGKIQRLTLPGSVCTLRRRGGEITLISLPVPSSISGYG